MIFNDNKGRRRYTESFYLFHRLCKQREKDPIRLHAIVLQVAWQLFDGSKTSVHVFRTCVPAATASATTTADFVYADFNSTHGLTFAGASGTTACANITELEYGNVHGDADQLQGSLDTVTREVGEEVVMTEVRTSELGEHIRITPVQVRVASGDYCRRQTNYGGNPATHSQPMRRLPSTAILHVLVVTVLYFFLVVHQYVHSTAVIGCRMPVIYA